MNVACVPYHDWRKIEEEGSRTRDAHLIHHLSKHQEVKNLIIVNRPITYTEMFLKKKNSKIKGELIYKEGGARLYKIAEGFFVFDFISSDILGPVFLKKKWFLKAFDAEAFYESFEKAMTYLSIKVDIFFSLNIFSQPFVSKYSNTVFDGWDNFVLFPENESIKVELTKAYQKLSDKATKWTTNVQKNADFYKDNYNREDCLVIRNGVDVELFDKIYEIPHDLSQIKKPIIGFGGKITHLFDYKLFNEVTVKHRDKSFVVVGQILNKEVFAKINFGNNVHYLGDKNYDVYPSYVTNFDVGIIPYVTNHLEHGADSIKVYEYIASGLGVVGTAGAGMTEMNEYMLVAKDASDFSDKIDKALVVKEKKVIPVMYTWKYKTDQFVELFQAVIQRKFKNENSNSTSY